MKNVECLPRQVGWFNEIGNKLICALCSDEENEGDATLHKEVMLIAYKWAKTRLISEASELDQADSSFVNGKIAGVKQKLATLDQIRAKCSSIKRTSDEVSGLAETLNYEINEELNAILNRLVKKESENSEIQPEG